MLKLTHYTHQDEILSANTPKHHEHLRQMTQKSEKLMLNIFYCLHLLIHNYFQNCL